MNSDYVPYDIADGMRSIGFDEPCNRFHVPCSEEGSDEISGWILTHMRLDDEDIPAPLYRNAFRWFREHQDWPIESWIQPYLSNQPRQYEAFYWTRGEKVSVGLFSSYSEAEIGLLRKLIELVKNR